MSAAVHDAAPGRMALWPGETLDLSGSERLWLVVSGEAQVFAVSQNAVGASDGLRWWLGSAGPGELLLGLASPPDALADRLVATGRAGTEIEPFDPARLRADAGPVLAAAAQRWACLLATGFSRSLGARPRLDVTLLPSDAPVLAPGGVAGAMQEGLWVDVEGGTVALFGLVSVSGLVPMPLRAWMTPEGPARLRVLNGIEAVARPSWLAGMRAVTAACLEALPLIRGLAEADELNRLRLRGALAQEVDAGTRAAMAQIFGDPAPTPSPAAGSSRADDGLFDVMAYVAQASGLQMRRPERVREADLDRLPDAASLARASNLRLRQVRLGGRWWRRDLGPLLAQYRDETKTGPVALLPGSGGYRIVDTEGSERLLTPAVASAIDAVAHALVPPLPDAAVGFSQLMRFGLPRMRKEVGALAAALIGGAALGQVVPFGIGLAFSLLIPAGAAGTLAQLAWALVAVAGVGYGVQLAQEIIRQRIETRATWASQAAVWDRVLRLPLPQIHRFSVGELTARSGAAANLSAAVRGLVLVGVGALATLLSSLATMLVHDPLASLPALAITLLQVSVAVIIGWRQERAYADGNALTASTDAMLFQFANGIGKLRLAGAEDRAFRRWAAQFAAMRARSIKARSITYSHDTWLAASGTFALVALYATIALLERPAGGLPRTSLSDVLAFFAAFALHMAAATGLAHVIVGLWMQVPGWRSARPLMMAVPEPATGRVDPGRLSGSIEIANLRFSYTGSETAVFSGLSARIEPGEFVAITGRSGTGKTTLVRLLLGLERPTGGSVAYDGQELTLLDLTAVRRQIGTVLQHGRLPPGTILEAVRGLSGAAEEEVWDALRDASVADDILATPMRLRTMLTDASRTLSGGQVQRLLIARALLQRPAILLLDEATSALDTATEAAVSRVLATMPVTRIAIAHRLSTIRQADRILHLEGGFVAEEGTYEDLVAAGNGFARLVAAG